MLKKFSYYLTFIIFTICFCFPVLAMAGVKLEAVYPYSLEQKKIAVVTGGSTMPLYINLQTFDIPQKQKVTFEVELPEHFMSLAENGWQQQGKGFI